MIELETKTTVQKRYLQPHFELHITGNPLKNMRTAHIIATIVDENGMRLEDVSCSVTGQEFNDFYSSYIDDRDVFALLQSKGLLENVEIQDGDVLNDTSVNPENLIWI